ncbi:MAG TPA: cellulase family glycosylhydrolase [Candidatus Angelobacter sp.]
MHLNSLSDPNRASLNVPFGTLRLWGIEGTAWFAINSAPGSYDWTTLDAFLDWAQTNNYAVIYTFGAGPCWVSPSSCQPNSDHASNVDHIADWDHFVTALVSHAKGRIKYYELWNEPTVNPYFWTGTIDFLAQMGQHAFQIIKSNDPNALVLTPSPQGDATGISQWMDQYLTAVQNLSQGTNAYADGIAFHSYEGAVPENVIPVIQQLQSTVFRHGLSLPLFDTEGSWGTSENLSDLGEQAAFVARSYALQASIVDRFAWYGWDYCLPGPGNCWGAMWKRPGVYIAEVCPSAGTFCGPVLLESGIAYATISQWLIGALVTACLDIGGGIWSCPVWRPGGYRAQILWSTGTDPAWYTVSSQFTQSRDLLTNCPRPIQNQAVTLGHLPILVETAYPGSSGSAACWWEALQSLSP